MKRPDTKTIRARADAATPGPWSAAPDRSSGDVALVEALTKDRRYVVREVCHVLLDDTNSESRARDRGILEFIAHARVDVPRLCDRVEALEAALRRLVPVLDSCVTAACAKVPPDYAETVDALDDVRAALEGTPK
jgi:hypothetical protein